MGVPSRMTKQLAIALGLSLALAACGAGEQQAGEPSGSATASADVAQADEIIASIQGTVTWPEVNPLSKAADISGGVVWWIPIGDGVPTIGAIGKGLEEAVTAAGGSTKLCDGRFNPSDIAACMKSAGDQGAAAVVVGYVDYMMVPTAYDQLVATGVPVIAVTTPPADGSKPKGITFFDQGPAYVTVYEQLAAGAISAVDGSAKALWLRLLDSDFTTLLADSGIAEFEELCPSCPIATLDFTTANLDKLPSAVSAALVTNPDTNVIVVPDDSNVPPVLQALKTGGLADGIKVVSESGDLSALQRIKAGEQAGTNGSPWIYVGWMVADATMRTLVGDPVPPQTDPANRYFTSANVADLTLTPEAFLSTQWYGDTSYESDFLDAWAAK